MLKEKIGFIGGGKMGEALMKGLLRAKLSSADKIIVSDVDTKRCQTLEDETGIKTTQENREVIANSDVIILAIKPNVMGTILEELKSDITSEHLVVSNNNFFLEPGESRDLTFSVYAPNNNLYGDYVGTVTIFLKD